MMNTKKIKATVLLAALFLGSMNSGALSVNASQRQQVWRNDLSARLRSSNANIYALVIRTFNANDKNGNGIIDIQNGEQIGTFINAIDRLDELKELGVDTIYLLPINSIGTREALGTAGSVYSMSDFSAVDPRLDDRSNPLDVFHEAKSFVDECHKRNIRVMLDLPSCGSMDMFYKNPNIFMQDENDKPIIPLDWRDVRMFRVRNANGSLNAELLKLHRNFVDMCLNLGIDGIRADVAALKPVDFWKTIISYARAKDPNFGFLAESSDSWTGRIEKNTPVSLPSDLLGAGFDSYYGSYFKIDEWKRAKELNNHVIYNMKLTNKYNASVIGSFATHDEPSPVYVSGGPALSRLIVLLEAFLPKLNPYSISGFESGDRFSYPYANKRAEVTYTDNRTYFVHPGKLDIFNFSRTPSGAYPEISKLMGEASILRKTHNLVITKGSFHPINIDGADKLIVFVRRYKDETVLFIGNMDYKNPVAKDIKLSFLTEKSTMSELLKTSPSSIFKFEGKTVKVSLGPSDAAIFKVEKAKFSPVCLNRNQCYQ